ncbi:MAG: NAD(P)/FAD-dependent oxidoreductase, partial [Halocynthiibacter sp.]
MNTKTPNHVIVIGAGIVGVSTAIWLRRANLKVTLIDRGPPGQGTSFGNGGVLAACAMVPVTTPGMALKGPKLLFDRNFPLFLRWSYLPKLAPWLLRYLSHANDRDTRRIALGLTPIVSDSLAQHRALTAGTSAARWVAESDYSFAYPDRAAFEADAYIWGLRHIAGFEPRVREGAEVQAYEPSLSANIRLLATLPDHGFIRDPGAYVLALAEVFQGLGGNIVTAEVRDFDTSGGQVSGVLTDAGRFDCDRAVVTAGVWSKPLMRKLGLNVPLESERGYHIVFENPTEQPKAPIMVTAGKFVATPMDAGFRCAGIVEYGGLEAGPSTAPFA